MKPLNTRYTGNTELSATITRFLGRLSDVVLNLPMEEEQRALLSLSFDETVQALHLIADLTVMHARMIESLGNELESIKEAQIVKNT